jgi:hypothetical protein
MFSSPIQVVFKVTHIGSISDHCYKGKMKKISNIYPVTEIKIGKVTRY